MMGRGDGNLHEMKHRVHGGTNDISVLQTRPRETESCNDETRKHFRVLLRPSLTVRVHEDEGVQGVAENECAGKGNKKEFNNMSLNLNTDFVAKTYPLISS